MSGLREREERQRDGRCGGCGAYFNHNPDCPGDFAPDPAASTADAPAATALRDQIAQAIEASRSWTKVMSDGHISGGSATSEEIADALLPLLRAHDAQVAAQARRDALNEAIETLRKRRAKGVRPDILSGDRLRHWFEGVGFSMQMLANLRDRAEQDTPDQG